MTRLTHRNHAAIAWSLLEKLDVDEVLEVLSTMLPILYADEEPRRHLFNAQNAREWVAAVGDRKRAGESFEEFEARNPECFARPYLAPPSKS